MKVFDARLALIRGGAVVVDGADLEAFDYLRTEMAQLLQPQKEQLVARLAVFLRHATQRYLAGELRFQERVYVERTLESIEWMLEAITGNAGSLRSAMEQGGHEKPSVRDAVRAGASAWFGDEQAGGILNSTPWNIKRGAP